MKAACVILALLTALVSGPSWAAEVKPDWRSTGKYGHLTRFIGTYEAERILSDPEVERELQSLTGDDYLRIRKVLTLSPIWVMDGSQMVIEGTHDWQGESERKLIVVDWYDGTVHVALATGDGIRLYSRAREWKLLPPSIKRFIHGAKLRELTEKPPSTGFAWDGR